MDIVLVLHLCPDAAHINHLSCQSEIAETTADVLSAKDEFK